MQALYLLALDPVAETTADPNSYGFRPQRSTADAIEQCFNVLGKRTSPLWILEGDIQGCFDHISHAYLLKAIGPAPGKERDLRNGSKQAMSNKRSFMQRSKERLKAAWCLPCWPTLPYTAWRRPSGSHMITGASSLANGQS
jgi:hypothetical protein